MLVVFPPNFLNSLLLFINFPADSQSSIIARFLQGFSVIRTSNVTFATTFDVKRALTAG